MDYMNYLDFMELLDLVKALKSLHHCTLRLVLLNVNEYIYSPPGLSPILYIVNVTFLSTNDSSLSA